MTCVPRHMDNALSVPERIPEDKSMPMGREENLSPSFVSCEIPQKSRLFLFQGELMDLTSDLSSASILGQLVHWSQKVRNFELFVAEEKRNVLLPYPSFSHGWFEKSDKELIEETMLSLTISSLHETLNFLIECGWVRTRVYLQDTEERTTQYRVNMRRLCADLHAQGYDLPGFSTYGI